MISRMLEGGRIYEALLLHFSDDLIAFGFTFPLYFPFILVLLPKGRLRYKHVGS